MEFFLPRVSPKYKLPSWFLLLPCKVLPNFLRVFPDGYFFCRHHLCTRLSGMTFLLFLAAIFLSSVASLMTTTSLFSSIRSSSVMRFPSLWFRFKFIILKVDSPISRRMTVVVPYAILNGVSPMAK
ncbi:hypothetical protein AAZX31_12G144900 [Glycine max]